MEPHWTAYMGALTLPLVAIVGAWIAYHQMVTAREKLRLDLYDRRMAVYHAAKILFRRIGKGDVLKFEDRDDFVSAVMGAQWLFDNEVSSYLSVTVSMQLSGLATTYHRMENLEPGPRLDELREDRKKLRNWFWEQGREIDTMFAPYFGFTQRATDRPGLFR